MTELQHLLRKLLNAMDERENELAMARESSELTEAEHHDVEITELRTALETHRHVTVGEAIDSKSRHSQDSTE